ncbi:MAG: hypothetical protein AB7I48_22660 [Planctomycetaceae bacterium]
MSYLHLLTRGASPAAACGQLGVSVLDVLATIEQDDAFHRRLEQVNVLLSQNVAAALYRSAMEGSVSAQTFFLKNQPPPNWQPDESDESADCPLDRMSDDELVAFCRASGIDWPSETAAGTDPPAVAD